MTELVSIHPNEHLPSLDHVVTNNSKRNSSNTAHSYSSSTSSTFSNSSKSTTTTQDDYAFSNLDSAFSRAASHGDVLKIKQLLTKDIIDTPDEDGTTPLIYAACFGKLEVVKVLLEAGAKVDVQDKIGWTALMWATTNGHDQIVELLLEYSACSETKSSSGKTLYDFVDTDNEKMFTLLTCTSPSPQMTSTLMQRRSSSNWRKLSFDQQQQQQQSDPSDNNTGLKQCENSFRSVGKFVWDQCLPDQMFVFAEEEMNSILNIAITELKLPIKTRAEIYVPANIVFLSARYSHYFAHRELLHSLLLDAVQRIKTVVKDNVNDIHTLSFWISNLSQLLLYLKKDSGLVVATAEHQLSISELISETYTSLVVDSETRLEQIVENALLEYEQLDQPRIQFADEWKYNLFFFSQEKKTIPLSSPKAISTLLTSTLYVLQSYEVHPIIVIQAIAQLFHFISCEMFNRILNTKAYLCRSKALQIRMNLTVLEEWIHENNLPPVLFDYFNQVVQLVQLLQCLSQLSDMRDFINTTFDLLNAKQIKRVVLNYRYEANEPRLPDIVEKYVQQLNTSETPNRRSRPSSVSSLGNLLGGATDSCPRELSEEELKLEQQEDEREWLLEQRDSRYMLPFTLPTVHSSTLENGSGWNRANKKRNSLSESIYMDVKQKMTTMKRKKEQNHSVPSIPEDWLERLDHRNKQHQQQKQGE